MNCVIVSSKYIDSISVLYLSCFICYKLPQLLKYARIFSVYTKMRLFKSQKTRGDRAKLLINLNSAHPNLKKNTYPHSCLRLKIYFCKSVLLAWHSFLCQIPSLYLDCTSSLPVLGFLIVFNFWQTV